MDNKTRRHDDLELRSPDTTDDSIYASVIHYCAGIEEMLAAVKHATRTWLLSTEDGRERNQNGLCLADAMNMIEAGEITVPDVESVRTIGYRTVVRDEMLHFGAWDEIEEWLAGLPDHERLEILNTLDTETLRQWLNDAIQDDAIVEWLDRWIAGKEKVN
jgi:hypothetical protein